jgi:hypothetical protein
LRISMYSINDYTRLLAFENIYILYVLNITKRYLNLRNEKHL